MSEHLKQTPLHAMHLSLGAKMGEFAGFDMPLQYSSIKEEVLAVRENLGIFDVSHMGEFFVDGPEAIKFVDYLLTNEFSSAQMHKAVYSPLCRHDGTVIDDLIAYKLSENQVMICVNASNINKDFDWMNEHVKDFDCQLTNRSEEFALLAIQGPHAIKKLQECYPEIAQVGDAPSFSVLQMSLHQSDVIIAKTGYTGEDGVEIFCSPACGQQVWQNLTQNGATPCGLVARDVLRLEACYPLYGQEIHDNVTPLDSALAWTVKFDKEDFIGKKALSDYQKRYKLIKLVLDRGIARQGHKIYSDEQGTTEIGEVTSGTMSVTLSKGIALAHIKQDVPSDLQKFYVEMRGRFYLATKQTRPFYKRS